MKLNISEKEQKNFTYYEVPQTGEVIPVLKIPINKEDLSELEEMLIELVKSMHTSDNQTLL